MIERNCPSFPVSIYVAGDIADAKRLCRQFCMEGLCVTVDATEFIYTGGSETGVRVGLINYPRFPKSDEEIWSTALRLADFLREGLFQHSVLVQSVSTALWQTNREGSV